MFVQTRFFSVQFLSVFLLFQPLVKLLCVFRAVPRRRQEAAADHFHAVLLKHTVDFHIAGNVEQTALPVLPAEEVQIDHMPDLVRQKHDPLTGLEMIVKTGIDKDAGAVGAGGLAAAVPDGDHFQPHGEHADEGLGNEQRNPIACKGLSRNVFLFCFVFVRFAYFHFDLLLSQALKVTP